MHAGKKYVNGNSQDKPREVDNEHAGLKSLYVSFPYDCRVNNIGTGERTHNSVAPIDLSTPLPLHSPHGYSGAALHGKSLFFISYIIGVTVLA